MSALRPNQSCRDSRPTRREDVVSEPASSKTPLEYPASKSENPSSFWTRIRSSQNDGCDMPFLIRSLASSQCPTYNFVSALWCCFAYLRRGRNRSGRLRRIRYRSRSVAACVVSRTDSFSKPCEVSQMSIESALNNALTWKNC